MRKLFVIIFLIISGNGCRVGSSPPQVTKFYHRDRLGDDGSARYSDYLAISNYESRPATARKLLQLANSYLDTAHAKLAIEGVTFMAKNMESPWLVWDSEILGQERKYFLVTFDYKHSAFGNLNKNRQLNSVTVWKHAEPIMYYQHSFYLNGKRMEGANLIDSILSSPQPMLNY